MSEPRTSAAVILVRPVAPGPDRTGLEIYLVRRRRAASFMPSAYVFPGGISELEDNDDLLATAVREVAEECGVTLDPGTLHYFAHWITPSTEKRRYSAYFYVAELPAGQIPAFDNDETVDEAWVTPAEALARAGELHLHPPQLRMFLDMAAAAEEGLPALLALCERRSASAHAILPRMTSTDGNTTVLLPWDPDYELLEQGEFIMLASGHPDAIGPSRFVLTDGVWAHVPVSPPA